MTIRGPSASQAARRLPAPESFRFVTKMTLLPRPPGVVEPNPSAPGKAGIADASLAAEPIGGKLTRAASNNQARDTLRKSLIFISPVSGCKEFKFASTCAVKSIPPALAGGSSTRLPCCELDPPAHAGGTDLMLRGLVD